MTLWLLFYLIAGAGVGTGAGVAQMKNPPRHRVMPNLWVEVAFYIFCWPVQLLPRRKSP